MKIIFIIVLVALLLAMASPALAAYDRGDGRVVGVQRTDRHVCERDEDGRWCCLWDRNEDGVCAYGARSCQ